MAGDLSLVLDLLGKPAPLGALATLVAVEGSSYRRPGARLAWWEDGRKAGGISGGCLEEDVLAHAAEVAQSGFSRHVAYNTDADGDPIFGLGTGCEGRLDIVIEPLGPQPHPLASLPGYWEAGSRPRLHLDWRNPGAARTILVTDSKAPTADPRLFVDRPEPPVELWVFGAGDDAVPLERIAAQLAWRIRIFDTRPALLSSSRFTTAALHPVDFRKGPSLPASWRPPVIVIMSHRFKDDLDALCAVHSVPSPYLGLLGSRKRCERLWAAFEERVGLQISAALMARTHAPVGLHLGGDGPAAVALSVLSEIQAVLHEGEVIPLAHRDRPIHEPAARASRGPLRE